jgi:hypothetical protein
LGHSGWNGTRHDGFTYRIICNLYLIINKLCICWWYGSYHII